MPTIHHVENLANAPSVSFGIGSISQSRNRNSDIRCSSRKRYESITLMPARTMYTHVSLDFLLPLLLAALLSYTSEARLSYTIR